MPNKRVDDVIFLDSDGEEFIPESQPSDDATQLPETQQYVAPGAAGGAADGAASQCPIPATSQCPIPAIPCPSFMKNEFGGVAMPQDPAERKLFPYCQGPTMTDDCPLRMEGGNAKAYYGSKKLGKVFCFKCNLGRAKIIKNKRIARIQKSKNRRKRNSKAQDCVRKWGHSQKGKINKEMEKQKQRGKNTQLERKTRAQKCDAAAAAVSAPATPACAAPAAPAPAAAAAPAPAAAAAPAPAAPTKPPPPPLRQSNAAGKEPVEMLSAAGRGNRLVWDSDASSNDNKVLAASPPRSPRQSKKPPKKRKKPSIEGSKQHGEGSSKPKKHCFQDDKADEDGSPKRREQQYHNVGWGSGKKQQPGELITAQITETMLDTAIFVGSKVSKQGRVWYDDNVDLRTECFIKLHHETAKTLNRRGSQIKPQTPQQRDRQNDGK
jgi:hypothetical protein